MAGTGVGKFSSTAGSNTANMTVNFAENMAPSNVNNAARELMGHMRDMYEQLGDGYFEFGDGDGTYTVARGDADTITITSASDISGIYFAGRKIRITDGGANVVEGTIASSSHSSTTQTVNLTGISLASGTPTKVELGIDTAAFGGRVILDDDGDTYIEAPTDDTIDIYVGGAKDFSITANSFNVLTGSSVSLADSCKLNIGTGDDLQIYHDGSNSFVEDAGTGRLTLISNGAGIQFNAAGEQMADFIKDGAVELFHNNVKKFETTSAGIAVTGTAAFESTSADDNFVITSTDADAGDPAPDLVLYRNSSSPANGDDIGRIEFRARNNNSQDIVPVLFNAFTAVVTDGSETGNFSISTLIGGSQKNRMGFDTTETTFNENSADLDFRVESNNDTHMLFVDAGNDHVNIKASADLGGVLNVSGSTVILVNDNEDTLTLKSTDADANSGPILVLNRDSGSPADNDACGLIKFKADDDGGNSTELVNISAKFTDVSNGAEDATFTISSVVGGSQMSRFAATASETVLNDDSGDIDFRVESNSNTHQLFVDASTDNVMIGTSTNIDRWFNSAPGHSTIFQTSGFNDANRVNAFTHHSNDSGGAMVMLGKSRGGAVGYTVVGDGDDIGIISFQGADGTDMVEAAKIVVTVEDAPGANDMPGRMTFHTTADGASSPTEHFRIANNGNLTATDTSIGSNSDSRLKENIADYTYDISKFKQFEAKTFDWKNPGDHNGKTGNRGFIAQEVAAIDDYWTDQISIDPDTEDAKLITADSDGNHNAYTLKLGKKDAMYISVIQQLIARIEALEG